MNEFLVGGVLFVLEFQCLPTPTPPPWRLIQLLLPYYVS